MAVATSRASETVSVRIALGLIAVAVLDDAFAPPDPGTSVIDHLAGGLVPVVLAAGFGWAYPHLRAGTRATGAFICGVLAIVAGVVERAQHVSALLAVLAGAGLLVIGIICLWRSRRRDGRRLLRRTLRGFVAIVAGFFVVLPVAFAIVATHPANTPPAPGSPFARVTLRTSDGLRIAGWYAPSRNRAAVIVFPGRPTQARLL